MSKHLLAFAACTFLVASACAQTSSVTLYGTIDLSGKYIKNDGSAKRLSLSQDGINSSQLGFRGTEDLGSGLKAGFTLLAGVNADTGTSNAKFFNRRSTVSLMSDTLGEVRLGRDYQPTFWNQTLFDAFGFNGVGNTANVRQVFGGVRMDNSAGYFLPGNLGGVYGQVMAAAAEGGSSGDRPGRYLGGRVGYAAGPFDVAIAVAQQRFASAFAIPGGQAGAAGTTANTSTRQMTWNVGGSYNLGFVKLMAYYDHEHVDTPADVSERMGTISAVIPFGANEVRFGYDRSKKQSGSVSTTVDAFKAAYQYNLSKRTALYGAVARLENKDGSTLSIAGGSSMTALPAPAGKSSGFEVGLRHFF